MSAATTTFDSPFAGSKVTFPRLLVSEWRKLWSLRSTWWVLGITVLLIIGFALIFSAAVAGQLSDPDLQAEVGGLFSPTLFVTIGYSFAALVAAALGAIAMTGEYSTGMIRATLSAAPTRLPVLWSKLVVIGVVVFLVVAVSTAVAYLVTDPILANHDVTVDLSDSTQLRSLIGVPLYVTMVALLAVAVGVLVRSTPGTIVIVVGLFFLVPGIIGGIAGATGQAWAENINKWLPSAAGERIVTQVGDVAPINGPAGPGMSLPLFDAWPGYGVLAAYTVVLIAAAAFVIKRRDA
ncbi:hypothetical protein Xcel_2674 [Xylanimonas cellulosilytica DSM 15894]|uniref:ABC transporter transmembrane protein n=1 Tax=Xylanimonas cellulosilytica (strain DSM 15894 / JCM 12276 / CECT 5975 / KCTC 9989 / LMG 20990 / NBRC 107835 / XIL07) TaxID=446471 RepID=D1BXP7_XYLCX|nr:ABC transporter permease subunit [Xylanimonas cellulosilytica]ACZ31688.1 hypothetical protein Xcel_2674 [Xylanimonas cellulosilytica DSM 15894]